LLSNEDLADLAPGRFTHMFLFAIGPTGPCGWKLAAGGCSFPVTVSRSSYVTVVGYRGMDVFSRTAQLFLMWLMVIGSCPF
jgi:hypothetical protein